MTTQEIADKLVAYCREGKFAECYTELYAPNCKSIEPEATGWPVAEGLEAMAEKGKKWNENIVKAHGGTVGDPIVANGYFSCTMDYDMTFKDRGRQVMSQICVYKVDEGKVTEERFFYPA